MQYKTSGLYSAVDPLTTGFFFWLGTHVTSVERDTTTQRRSVIRTIASAGLCIGSSSLAFRARGDTNEANDAAELFKDLRKKHGRIMESNIKGLGDSQGNPSPEWKIKYTFKQGRKVPAFYNLESNSLELRVAGEQFSIGRESHEAQLSQVVDEMNKMEEGLNQDLQREAQNHNRGDQ